MKEAKAKSVREKIQAYESLGTFLFDFRVVLKTKSHLFSNFSIFSGGHLNAIIDYIPNSNSSRGSIDIHNRFPDFVKFIKDNQILLPMQSFMVPVISHDTVNYEAQSWNKF